MYTALTLELELERIQEFEKDRKKWVARDQSGNEFLMINCQACQQPYARQQVIRLTHAEFEEWKKIVEEEKAPFKNQTVAKFKVLVQVILELTLFGAIGFFIYLWLKPSENAQVIGIVSGIIIAVAYYCWTFIKESKKEARQKKDFSERRQRVLGSRNISEKEVGMMEDYWKKYVVLPRQ